MSDTESNVIVAIPAEDDRVWQISSEKIPHMTLLYLNAIGDSPTLEHTLEYIQHVARTLPRFGLSVDRRGTLGDDEADVLFFEKDWQCRSLEEFRSNLLKNTELFTAYTAVTQYPEWTPHLTMGYPEAPAKVDNSEYPRFSWVRFDRIALWTKEYDGPTFDLPSDTSLEVAMNDQNLNDVLSHHGIKGQKWGVRRANPSGGRGATEVTIKPTKPGKYVKTSGGQRHEATSDAITAAKHRQKAKKSTTDALSNKELQEMVTRMNLEQQYSRLKKSSDRSGRGARFIKSILGAAKKPENQKAFKDFSKSDAAVSLKEKLKSAGTAA